ncbi:MAG: hemin uptake protein HemP [Pseudomonadota bacterium]
MQKPTPQTAINPGQAAAQPTYSARDLTNDGTTAYIDLDGQLYILRITRAGKLILTK